MKKHLSFFIVILVVFMGSYSHVSAALPQKVKTTKQTTTPVKKTKKDKKAQRIADLTTPKDTIKRNAEYWDSLKKNNPIEFVVDSLDFYKINLDSVNLDSIARRFFTDTIKVSGGVVPVFNTVSSVKNALRLDSMITQKSILEKKRMKALGLRKDTMSLVTTTAISLFVPGFAQIRNRDYWKLPVLYGTVGGFLGLGFMSNNSANLWDRRYKTAIKYGSPEAEMFHIKADRMKTQSALFFTGAALSYLYFLAEGISKYSGPKGKSPVKAGLIGLFVPGGGQIYNKSYWKLPIYYGGLGALTYVIVYNTNGYNRYSKAYEDVANGRPDEFNGRYTLSQLKVYRDDYRRSRDMSIFYMAGVYLLGVIEAYVDASFKTYDVSDNLAMKIRPTIESIGVGSTTNNSSMFGNSMVGVSVDLKIK